jgi:hypothetical protein
MTRTLLIASVLTFSAFYAVGVAEAASESVREACTADAKKLCDSVIANAAKRHACMASHRSELSEKCTNALKKEKKG